MVFLIRSLEGINDLLVSSSIEVQELLVAGEDAKAAGLTEEAVLGLPEQYRSVVMLRDVEELSTTETAAALDLTEQNVKVRLHRGHAMLRGWLLERVGAKAKDAFPFMGVRCDRIVHAVFQRIAESFDGHASL